MRLRFVADALICALLLSPVNTSLADRGAATSEVTAVSPKPGGVVVRHVNLASSADKAGLKPGDLLLSWSRPRSLSQQSQSQSRSESLPSGKFDTILDWQAALWTTAHLGPARLRLRRAGTEMTVDIATSWLGADVTPTLDKALASAYLSGREAWARREPPASWESAVRHLREAGDWSGSWWLSLQLGTAHASLGRHDSAEQWYRRSLELARDKLEAPAHAIALTRWGQYLWSQDRVAAASGVLKQAVSLWRKADPNDIGAAQAEISLAATSNFEVELTAAEQALKHILRRLTSIAPDSLPVALTRRQLGTLEWSRGAYQVAEAHFLAGLRIMERLDPRAEDACWLVYLIGGMFTENVDLGKANHYLNRALKLANDIGRNQYLLGVIHNALGSIAMDQGKHALASEHLLHALALFERVAPGKLVTANPLINLSVVADERLNFEKAEYYSRRTLDITSSNGPKSDSHAIGLLNLGYVLLQQGKIEQADIYLAQANEMEIIKAAPRLRWATTYLLGEAALRRGRYARAESHFQAALEIQQMNERTPLLLFSLATLAIQRKDFQRAGEYYRQSLEITASLAPGSRRHAEALFGLARVARATGDKTRAADYLRAAIAALESQIGKLGASEEIRSQFRAGFHHYYREYIDLLLELDQPELAYHILERSRARQFTEMLALRELDFQELPVALNESLKQNAASYDATQARLAGLAKDKSPDEHETLLRRLSELRAQRNTIIQRLRETSPRLAGLTHPQPLTLKQVQGTLQADTVLLAYSTGQDRLHIFVVTRDNLRVYSRALGEHKIRALVNGFRARIALGRDAPLDPVTRKRAQELYELLLAPVADHIDAKNHLVLMPDGPLHRLPYAALLKDEQYLIEWKPLLNVLSGSVYAELKARASIQANSLVGFGDPDYARTAHAGPASGVSDNEATYRGVSNGGFKPLPASRQEVEYLKALFGDRAEIFLGQRATEKRAKSLSGETRYLHFATHAVLNENFPLDSGLVLAPPLKTDTDNGVLQAWEIIEQLRLEADMVTLSACETALGKERNGEGLLGLSRAFLHAGARSVLASLWKVEDESTAEFMRHVYRQLRDGKSKAEALRAAQLAMIRDTAGGHAANPYHWAGFQLIGLGE